MSTLKNINSSANISGSVSSDYLASSGKQNLMCSFNMWLMEVVQGGQDVQGNLQSGKDFYWAFDYPLAPLKMPAIATSEIGLFNLGARSFDENLVGFTEEGKPIRAVRNQTLIEINCWAQDSDNFGGATKKVRELRDRVAYALQFTGTRTDDDSAFVLPPMRLRDYSKPDAPVIGMLMLDPAGNAINEKFLIDPVVNQLKRYKLLVRVLYDEYKNQL
jgi:hypothetical protein